EVVDFLARFDDYERVFRGTLIASKITGSTLMEIRHQGCEAGRERMWLEQRLKNMVTFKEKHFLARLSDELKWPSTEAGDKNMIVEAFFRAARNIIMGKMDSLSDSNVFRTVVLRIYKKVPAALRLSPDTI